jgi:hypothetical protein
VGERSFEIAVVVGVAVLVRGGPGLRGHVNNDNIFAC